MQEKHRIAEDIILVESMRKLVQAYEEISVVHMQAIRGQVIKTRDFLNQLSDVLYNVKSSYRTQIIRLMQQKKKKTVMSFSTIAKNGKSVIVFLSGNKRLYGDITAKIFELFIEEAKKRIDDLVIVGTLGRNTYEERGILRSYQYFDLPDQNVSFENLKQLISYIVQYERVTVFHGKFINIISQTPTAAHITGEQPLDEPNPQSSDKNNSFLFEPTLEKILSFFEAQTFTSLFSQTVHEGELARYASRIRAMEESLGNINGQLHILQGQHKRYTNLNANKKQLQQISGISLWGTRM